MDMVSPEEGHRNDSTNNERGRLFIFARCVQLVNARLQLVLPLQPHGRLRHASLDGYTSTTLSISIHSKLISFFLEDECTIVFGTGIVVLVRSKAIVETSNHVLKAGSTGKETRIRYDALFEAIE